MKRRGFMRSALGAAAVLLSPLHSSQSQAVLESLVFLNHPWMNDGSGDITISGEWDTDISCCSDESIIIKAEDIVFHDDVNMTRVIGQIIQTGRIASVY